ncbi:hypothetical protein HUG20_16900 [Salicibibacter cibi]|uniref:Uncharacterized protein n=1 Tax=Salicibibacter cibi TaxID=2743001 RepID=A0A7T6ZDB1_9BACI|nr:hypothetical protein [Salicibibacter cibi]QQK81421.1 hypothetical protein HUG20_16900 [Salicibibacter cibi]
MKAFRNMSEEARRRQRIEMEKNDRSGYIDRELNGIYAQPNPASASELQKNPRSMQNEWKKKINKCTNNL